MTRKVLFLDEDLVWDNTEVYSRARWDNNENPNENTKSVEKTDTFHCFQSASGWGNLEMKSFTALPWDREDGVSIATNIFNWPFPSLYFNKALAESRESVRTTVNIISQRKTHLTFSKIYWMCSGNIEVGGLYEWQTRPKRQLVLAIQ